MNDYFDKSNANTQEIFSNLLISEDYMNSIYGFAYKRTFSRSEAEELSQEIIAELLAVFKENPNIERLNAFIWKVAYNTYAEWVNQVKRRPKVSLEDTDDLEVSVNSFEDDVLTRLFDEQRYNAIMREMAFLSKIYRDVMVMFYLDEKPIAEIARILSIPENRVKQRLFSAKEKIRKEVDSMDKNLTLKPNELWFHGSGDFSGGDPRNHAMRLLSKNTLILCKDRAKSLEELSKELNVPSIFMENELDILTTCGLLRKTATSKYITDFIIIDYEVQKQITEIYKEYIDILANEAVTFVEKNKDKIENINYLVHPVNFDFILWSLVPRFTYCYEGAISRKVISALLDEGVTQEIRKYYIVGTIINPNDQFDEMKNLYSWNGNTHRDLAGFKSVYMSQFNGKRLPYRFGYMGISNNPEYLLMLNCIEGLPIGSLSEDKKEIAAKAIADKLIKKQGNMLYPNILVFDKESYEQFETLIFEFEAQIDELAGKMVAEYIELINKCVPKHLMGQSRLFVECTGSVMNLLLEKSIEKQLLYIPDIENCAEGMWAVVEK